MLRMKGEMEVCGILKRASYSSGTDIVNWNTAFIAMYDWLGGAGGKKKRRKRKRRSKRRYKGIMKRKLKKR